MLYFWIDFELEICAKLYCRFLTYSKLEYSEWYRIVNFFTIQNMRQNFFNFYSWWPKPFQLSSVVDFLGLFNGGPFKQGYIVNAEDCLGCPTDFHLVLVNYKRNLCALMSECNDFSFLKYRKLKLLLMKVKSFPWLTISMFYTFN